LTEEHRLQTLTTENCLANGTT